MRRTPLVLAVLLLAVPTMAQQSASFKLEEQAFNAGGHPAGGSMMASASFRVTLDSIGDSVAGTFMGSASFHMDGGLAWSYPPPGEVRDLRFLDDVTLAWDPERSVGDYGLYSGSVSDLESSDYGECSTDVPVETAVVGDTVLPGECLFYLVTARNRLGEEGTLGLRTPGVERPNTTPCP